MANLNNKIETSSAAIGYFLYHGTYETYIGERIGCVARENRETVNDEIGALYIDVLTDALSDMFCNLSDDFELSYIRTSMPRYYNFETDSIIFEFAYSDAIRNWMFDHAQTNDFREFLHDKYTSYDGFVSFTPNNWNDWVDGWNENDWRCVSALLHFIIENEITDGDKESYWYSFNEDVATMIDEKYIPYEYAVKFDNGYIAVVRNDYDDVSGYDVFNAWLLDDNLNVINTAKFDDEYNEFNYSAYAVIEYSNIVRELTNNYSLCWYNTEECEVPKFDAA